MYPFTPFGLSFVLLSTFYKITRSESFWVHPFTVKCDQQKLTNPKSHFKKDAMHLVLIFMEQPAYIIVNVF